MLCSTERVPKNGKICLICLATIVFLTLVNFVVLSKFRLVQTQPSNLSTQYRWNAASTPVKARLLLLLIVSTAPQRSERRQAIRRTWWRKCKMYNQIRCVFFTDGDLEDRGMRRKLAREQAEHRDMLFQPFSGGGSFGKRFLHHMEWAKRNFEFDYFMRLDDDMMLCIDRLVLDLPLAPKSNLIWSWVHCTPQIVRPEESFIIISRDIVDMFLNQSKRKMLCHALADQQVALWVQDLQLTNIYYSDQRIHHHPPASHMKHMFDIDNICHLYIALHGVYRSDMFTFWEKRGPQRNYPKFDLHALGQVCDEEQVFDWSVVESPYGYVPKLCAENPTWDTSALMGDVKEYFDGRQG